MYTVQDEVVYDSVAELMEQLEKDKEIFRNLLLKRMEADGVIDYAYLEGEVINKLEEWVGL